MSTGRRGRFLSPADVDAKSTHAAMTQRVQMISRRGRSSCETYRRAARDPKWVTTWATRFAAR